MMRLRCLAILFFTLSAHIDAQSSSSSSTTATTTSTRSSHTADDPLGGYRIVCLYNNKQFQRLGHRASMINPHLCTHINYEFAHLDHLNHEMKPGLPEVDIHQNMYKEVIGLKKINPKLIVMLSLGGWEDSTPKYSDLMKSGEKVQNFIDKCVAMLKELQFDGLDVAMEYPNCWQGALHQKPEDKHNFVVFLEKLRKRFDKEVLILSVSVTSIKREMDAGYDAKPISRAVHHMNVMTYDMHGPWEPVTGHHTQLDKIPGEKDPTCNTIAAMNFWVQMGVEKEKLNLGIATYAKTFTLRHAASHGLGAPAKGGGRPGAISKETGHLCYSEICQYLNAGNWTEEEQRYAGFYAFSGDQWACYDPPMMAVKKSKWMVENGFGGMLIKDLSCDDFQGRCFNEPYLLTKMVHMEIKHRVKETRKAQARAQSSAQSGAQSSAQSGAQSSGQSGSQARAQSSAQSGVQSSAQAGA